MLFLVTKSRCLVTWSQRQRQSDNHIAFFLFQDSPISYVNKSFISVTTLVLLALIGVYHAVEVQVIFLYWVVHRIAYQLVSHNALIWKPLINLKIALWECTIYLTCACYSIDFPTMHELTPDEMILIRFKNVVQIPDVTENKKLAFSSGENGKFPPAKYFYSSLRSWESDDPFDHNIYFRIYYLFPFLTLWAVFPMPHDG